MPIMSFQLSPDDYQRLSFARCDRFDEVMPNGYHFCMVHNRQSAELKIIGGDREAAWFWQHTAEIRYWAWITLGAEQLTVLNGEAQIYSQQTFPFFEARVKSGLKLKKRSRLRNLSHANCNPGKDHSEWG